MGSMPIPPQALPGTRLPNGLFNQWHSQPRKLKIVHVGFGATGICTAFKMERQLTDYELVCYEKNDELGGTWYESMISHARSLDLPLQTRL
jgi:cation diffusion facilitator CzcD-associated flavoprotein CzcO